MQRGEGVSRCRDQSAFSPVAQLAVAGALWLAVAGFFLASERESKATWSPREGLELVGTPAPEWLEIEWMQGGPSLRELWEAYRDRGLVVVGLHHPKSEETRRPERVESAAHDLGFEFPIGLDNSWTTIRAYGVGRKR